MSSGSVAAPTSLSRVIPESFVVEESSFAGPRPGASALTVSAVLLLLWVESDLSCKREICREMIKNNKAIPETQERARRLGYG